MYGTGCGHPGYLSACEVGPTLGRFEKKGIRFDFTVASRGLLCLSAMDLRAESN